MVNINLLDEINNAVDSGLSKIGLPSTPHNRVEVLSGMHKKISSQTVADPSDRLILQAIEDEIIRLQDQL